MQPVTRTRLRLGSFLLDLKTGELRPLGPGVGDRKVVLQEQPLRVLRILIERSGQIATRAEIKSSLWPNDTVVDFDHNINVAIGTLRRLLEDSAAQPNYIQTVARRGYRLLVTPEWEEANDDQRGEEATAPAGTTGAGGLIGRKVSHFRVLEVIGGGGMGMVYKAEDLKLGRQVALKFLPEEMAADPVSLKRFVREAQTASSLNHPNICTVFEIDEHHGQPIIVMELLEGETLRDRLAALKSGAMPLAELIEVALQSCDGLQAAHSRGIIHRDIKPANIFLKKEGTVKILDFGLAKTVSAEDEGQAPTAGAAEPGALSTSSRDSKTDIGLTRTGAEMGTTNYMSPEQVRKEKLDARTDLFSFGLVLYEMATGQRAFPGDHATGVNELLLAETPIPVRDLNPSAPPSLQTIVEKALQKDRMHRYQSAAGMRADLEVMLSPKQLSPKRFRKWITITALALIAVGAALAYWHYRTGFQLSATDTIVIADVVNQTSDPVLSDALNTALPIELAQTPFLQVLSQDKVRETMKMLGERQDAPLTPEIARQVCLKTNSKAVVTSSIADAGNHYRLVLRAIDCQTNQTFARAEQDASLRTEAIHALGVAGIALRGNMGEPRESVSKFNKPLELATSSSPEALRLVAQAFKRHMSPDVAGTSALYERAVDIDPSFALAYASLGTVDLARGNLTGAIAHEKRAYELRDRLTGQLRFLAETLYHSIGAGDLEKAFPVYEEWVRTFPLDGVAHNNFAACLLFLGHYDGAAAEAREALRLMPVLGVGSYWGLMASTTYANRLDEAKVIFAQAQARKVDSPDIHDLRHLIGFLQHDVPAMREQLEWFNRSKGFESARHREADLQCYTGRFAEARRLAQRQSEDLASNATNPLTLPTILADIARQEAEAGQLTAAQELARRSFSLFHHNRLGQLDLAMVAARTGDVAQAENLADAINREAPQDTLVQYYYLPVIRAAIQIHKHNAKEAVEILRPAEKYELTTSRPFNSLYPAYLRGLAYLQLGQGSQAATEFQKLLNHPAIVGRYVTGTLARLQLGRAEAMMGGKAAARKSYQDFLTLWKDADPDLPIYRQAKSEFAALR